MEDLEDLEGLEDLEEPVLISTSPVRGSGEEALS